MTESTLQKGYTSPVFREDLFAPDQPRKKRNPIGFVHFWEPEEEPPSDWEYQELMEKWEREDELRVGFTAPTKAE
jgi:hypothetical protein